MSKIVCTSCRARYEEEESACPECGATRQSISAPQVAGPDDNGMPQPHRCMARGCPLSGTWNPVIHGPTSDQFWQCFIHSELPASKWQEATRQIRHALPALQHIADQARFRWAMRSALKDPGFVYCDDLAFQSATSSAFAEEVRRAYARSQHGSQSTHPLIVRHQRKGDSA